MHIQIETCKIYTLKIIAHKHLTLVTKFYILLKNEFYYVLGLVTLIYKRKQANFYIHTKNMELRQANANLPVKVRPIIPKILR